MIQHIVRYVQHHQLAMLIIGAVAIALVSTTLSVVLYVRSGAVLLDLSRPGYAPVREQIHDGDLPRFEADGEMDAETIEGFRELYTGQIKDFNKLGDFDSKVMDDTRLYLN